MNLITKNFIILNDYLKNKCLTGKETGEDSQLCFGHEIEMPEDSTLDERIEINGGGPFIMGTAVQQIMDRTRPVYESEVIFAADYLKIPVQYLFAENLHVEEFDEDHVILKDGDVVLNCYHSVKKDNWRWQDGVETPIHVEPI